MPLLEVTVAGSRIGNIIQESFQIESILGQVVDTCDFAILDVGSPGPATSIRTLQDVVVTRADTGDRVFAGLASYIDGTPNGIERTWELGCQDYTILLDRSLVLQNFPAGYTYDGLVGDRAIIAGAFERFVVGAGGANTSSEIEARDFVEQGLSTLAQQAFKYSTLRELVSQLAQYVGFDFYVDYGDATAPYGRLHYYYREDARSPYELTDRADWSHGGPSTVINYQKVNWKRDGTRLVNTFALFGDRLLSSPNVFVLATTGATEYVLDHATIRLNFPIIAEPGQRNIRVDVNANANRPLTGDQHTGAQGAAVLTATGATFVTDGVVVGDVVVNSADQSWGEVTGVTQTTLTASLREGVRGVGAGRNVWNVGDRAVVPTWRALTVSSDPLAGIGDAEAFHDGYNQTLVFAAAPGASRYGVRLRFVHSFVGGQIDTDHGSVARYNRTFSRRVIASDVNSAAGIRQKLEHLKEQYAFALEVVILTVDDGSFPTALHFAQQRGSTVVTEPDRVLARRRFRVGDWVSFQSVNLGRAPKDFLIHRMSTRIAGVDPEDPTGTSSESTSHLVYELELRDWEVEIS